MPKDDNALVEAYLQGDQSAFTELYERYIRRIYDFLYYKTHHKETAEDLASVTFMKAFENIGQFNPSKGVFSAWLHRIARNTAFDHYRSFKRTEDIEDAWDLAGNDDVVRDADALLQIEKVQEYMKTLKADQRDILLMRLWHGMSFAEIAEVLGKQENACKVAYHRAVKAMRAELLLAFLLLFFSSR